MAYLRMVVQRISRAPDADRNSRHLFAEKMTRGAEDSLMIFADNHTRYLPGPLSEKGSLFRFSLPRKRNPSRKAWHAPHPPRH